MPATMEPLKTGTTLSLLLRPLGRGEMPDAASLRWLVRGYDLDFIDLRPPADAAQAGRFVVLTVGIIEHETPAECRVRRLLKGLLRGLGVRCVAILPPGRPVPALTEDLDAAKTEPPF